MELTKKQLTAALAELERELEAKQVFAVLRVIGGAAIALKYDATRVTADVDSIFDNYELVRDAVEATAARLGLPQDWVNSQIRDLGLPFDADESPDQIVIGPHLTLEIASAEFLLFTKVISSRQPDQDFDDAVILARHLGASSAQEIEGLVKKFGPIDGPVELFIEDIADEL